MSLTFNILLCVIFKLNRGIGFTNKSEDTLRTDLQQWFALLQKPPQKLGVKVNDQNKRLTLMALHVAKESKLSVFSKEYRSLFAEFPISRK
jgi:hypothetical protein